MFAVTISKAEIEALDPCYERWDLLKDKLPEQITADVAVEAGATLEDLLWALTESKKHDTLLHLFIADVAAHVLHIYERTESSSAPRKAIIARRALARGEITLKQWQVARDVAKKSAVAAADAAAWAIVENFALVASKNAASAASRNAANDAAWGAARDAAWNTAWDTEEEWQLQRLLVRLNNPNIPDWPLYWVCEIMGLRAHGGMQPICI